MTTPAVAGGSRPFGPWKGSSRAVAWAVLLVLVLSGRVLLSGRGVWSSWYAPLMPALWLQYRATDGVPSFAWCYSGAGAILGGPGILDLWLPFAPWQRRVPAFAGLVVASAVVKLIDSGVHGEVGVSAGFGLVLLVSIAVFIWAQEAALALEASSSAQSS